MDEALSILEQFDGDNRGDVIEKLEDYGVDYPIENNESLQQWMYIYDSTPSNAKFGIDRKNITDAVCDLYVKCIMKHQNGAIFKTKKLTPRERMTLNVFKVVFDTTNIENIVVLIGSYIRDIYYINKVITQCLCCFKKHDVSMMYIPIRECYIMFRRWFCDRCITKICKKYNT